MNIFRRMRVKVKLKEGGEHGWQENGKGRGLFNGGLAAACCEEALSALRSSLVRRTERGATSSSFDAIIITIFHLLPLNLAIHSLPSFFLPLLLFHFSSASSSESFLLIQHLIPFLTCLMSQASASHFLFLLHTV